MAATFQSTIALISLLTLSMCGCSQSRGFYVLPAHRDLGLIGRDTRIAVAQFEVINGLNRPVAPCFCSADIAGSA